jgi:hypothetical protein
MLRKACYRSKNQSRNQGEILLSHRQKVLHFNEEVCLSTTASLNKVMLMEEAVFLPERMFASRLRLAWRGGVWGVKNDEAKGSVGREMLVYYLAVL